jgi:hypothetical protein
VRSGLPAEHEAVLDAVLAFFRSEGAVACFVSGSVAAGNADRWSDLDVGACMRNERALEELWARRWEWEIAPWFHRFDADHVASHFVIYFFEPDVKADLHLYLPEELPPTWPHRVLWDDAGVLEGARVEAGEVDWSNAVHEDERLWAWTYYCAQHIARGEYYDVASDFSWLRDVVEQWQARLRGEARFEQRRLEQRLEPGELVELFPDPDRESLKRALLTLLDVHDRQRALLDLPWRTTEAARVRIRGLVESL